MLIWRSSKCRQYDFASSQAGNLRKRTVGKSWTNATNVNLPLLRQATWGDICKDTVGKSPTNGTSVTLHQLRQAIWGHIWKSTVEKNQTNATNVNMLALIQVHWGDTWKRTVEKCNQCEFASSPAGDLRRHLQRYSGEKSNKHNQYGFTSSYSSVLRTYLKIHIGEKPNECNQCDYALCSMHPVIQAVWGHTWKHTVEKSLTNATSVTWHKNTFKNISRKVNKCNQCKFASSQTGIWRRHFLTHISENQPTPTKKFKTWSHQVPWSNKVSYLLRQHGLNNVNWWNPGTLVFKACWFKEGRIV